MGKGRVHELHPAPMRALSPVALLRTIPSVAMLTSYDFGKGRAKGGTHPFCTVLSALGRPLNLQFAVGQTAGREGPRDKKRAKGMSLCALFALGAKEAVSFASFPSCRRPTSCHVPWPRWSRLAGRTRGGGAIRRRWPRAWRRRSRGRRWWWSGFRLVVLLVMMVSFRLRRPLWAPIFSY